MVRLFLIQICRSKFTNGNSPTAVYRQKSPTVKTRFFVFFRHCFFYRNFPSTKGFTTRFRFLARFFFSFKVAFLFFPQFLAIGHLFDLNIMTQSTIFIVQIISYLLTGIRRLWEQDFTHFCYAHWPIGICRQIFAHVNSPTWKIVCLVFLSYKSID